MCLASLKVNVFQRLKIATFNFGTARKSKCNTVSDRTVSNFRTAATSFVMPHDI